MLSDVQLRALDFSLTGSYPTASNARKILRVAAKLDDFGDFKDSY